MDAYTTINNGCASLSKSSKTNVHCYVADVTVKSTMDIGHWRRGRDSNPHYSELRSDRLAISQHLATNNHGVPAIACQHKYRMLISELFSMPLTETRIVLRGGPTGETPVSRFMAEFVARTQESMFNHRQRVFGMAVIELSPSINDRSSGIHIDDLLSNVKGEGTKALAMICELADAHGVTLDLFAMGYAKTPTAKLIEWYRRFGFIPDPDSIGDEVEGMDMIRKPVKKGKLDLSGGDNVTIKLRGFDKRPH